MSAGKIYLSDWRGTIYRTGLGGSPVETLVFVDRAEGPIGLDLSRGKMYFGEEQVWRANLDGSQVEVIVRLNSTRDFEVDESGGKLYWASNGGIGRANLDGSQVETLFTENSFGLALDLGAGKIYWTAWIDDEIQRANLDGSQVETIVVGLRWPKDIALGP